ncbi:hypothetical protein B0H63DRAFT_552729 [Podospora didyma]|uniref:Secreted protein n=1 Tax=Podospora didyma TaxID=330526 RepID=A0AAE0K5T5_9PEZI|nr:hypothetical protein B0H63DRAFT_552729 [Podospora didyma]
MHFNIPTTLVLALGTLTTRILADSMHVSQYCFFLYCTNQATFYTDQARFDGINANSGCRNPGIPHMIELCVDEGNQRAHFQFQSQGKRCMHITSSTWQTCSDDFRFATCATAVYEETPCTW